VPSAGVADILRYGAEGPGVLAWQQELWRLGYGVGMHDSVFGPAVTEQTRLFQIAAGGINVDTEVGPATRAMAASVATYPKPDGPALPLCQQDGDPNTIRAFQQRLFDRGWKNMVVDSKFGPTTQGIIRSFQKEKGLDIDGVGGPQVWTALFTRPV